MSGPDHLLTGRSVSHLDYYSFLIDRFLFCLFFILIDLKCISKGNFRTITPAKLQFSRWFYWSVNIKTYLFE